jgi:type IV secretory pathway VirD2 relaxase
MARNSARDSASKVEPDRVGKMHGRHRELSVRAQLARRLRGFRGKAGRVGRQSFGGRRLQRVIVKTHVARHKPGKARGSLTRHASYLGRDSASADGKPGVFYDATQQGLDAKDVTAAWVPDRHHFRIIISPERGGDIPDMTAYVRDVMRRVEKDLTVAGVVETGTKLQWIAINHNNTDNPHAHVVLRGKLADGRDLVIPRAYLAHGMRTRASEVATEILGERTVEQAREARLKEVEAERFTSLDRMIERHLEPRAERNGENKRIDLSPAKPIGFGADDRQLALARLQFLEGMGLAQKEKGTYWSLDETFGLALRELGARNDIIKQLYSQLGNESGRVQRMTGGAEVSAPVAGVVVAKDRADELEDDRFIVVRDGNGQAHYGRVRDTQAYRDLHVGSVAELGAGTHWRQEVAAQIGAIAQASGAYSPQAHKAYVRQAKPDSTEREVASAIRSAQSRLAFVAGFEGSGVRALETGEYAMDADQYARFSHRGGSRTDVRVIAEHTLERQIEAHAVTWLDRQAFSDRPDARMAEHAIVQDAIGKRHAWLVRNGYAQRVGEGGEVVLNPDALSELAAEERADVTGRLAGKFGLPVAELPQGGTVAGEYGGTEILHSGKLAVVVTEDKVFVSPVFRTPTVDAGSPVELQRASASNSTVELTTVGQVAEQSARLDASASLDGPGGD